MDTIPQPDTETLSEEKFNERQREFASRIPQILLPAWQSRGWFRTLDWVWLPPVFDLPDTGASEGLLRSVVESPLIHLSDRREEDGAGDNLLVKLLAECSRSVVEGLLRQKFQEAPVIPWCEDSPPNPLGWQGLWPYGGEPRYAEEHDTKPVPFWVPCAPPDDLRGPEINPDYGRAKWKDLVFVEKGWLTIATPRGTTPPDWRGDWEWVNPIAQGPGDTPTLLADRGFFRGTFTCLASLNPKKVRRFRAPVRPTRPWL